MVAKKDGKGEKRLMRGKGASYVKYLYLMGKYHAY